MIDKDSFRKYLKNKGKKDNVVDRNINTVNTFLSSTSHKTSSNISKDDIQEYVEYLESDRKSAKGFLYVMMNYFKFLNDIELYSYSAKLREERTSKTRRKFKLKQFLGVDKKIIGRLEKVGITDVSQMLKNGKTKAQREQLAKKMDVPEDKILELVNLSDLTRMGYIKKKLSRLYYDAGLHSPADVAKYEPDDLYEHFKAYIEKVGWDGMIPNRKDLVYNINSARKLKRIVEY